MRPGERRWGETTRRGLKLPTSTAARDAPLGCHDLGIPLVGGRVAVAYASRSRRPERFFLLHSRRRRFTFMIIVSNPLQLPGKDSRTVSVSDFRLHTGKLLRSVARGRELTITRRRKAVARILPLGPEVIRPGANDPFFRLADRAESMGVLDNAQIDEAQSLATTSKCIK